MRSVDLALGLGLALAGCSVPAVNLDGKQCPCAAGYTCETASNTCRSSTIDAAPPGSSCLGAEAARIFTIDWNDDLTHVTTGAGTWSATGGALHQADAATTLAFAYSTSAVPSDYRVALKLEPATGTGLGVAFRVALGAKTQYDCEWVPATGQLLLQWTNNGGNPTVISTVTAAPTSSPVTMHAEARGTTLACCLDEVPAAKLTGVTDTHYANGQPGAMSDRMAAAFDDLVVSELP